MPTFFSPQPPRWLRWLFDDPQPNIDAETPVVTSDHAGRLAVIVLDASSSMDADDYPPTRLKAAREAALTYVERLAQEDTESRVAIVTYANDAQIACNLTPVTDAATLKRSLKKLRADGCTNLSADLHKALTLLKDASDAQQQVIVLSDGEVNAGGAPIPAAVKLKRRAIIECVGIGGAPTDVNEDLLKRVASTYPDGAPRYRWIGDKTRLVAHFHQLAGGLSRT